MQRPAADNRRGILFWAVRLRYCGKHFGAKDTHGRILAMHDLFSLTGTTLPSKQIPEPTLLSIAVRCWDRGV
jgi:hypothetical protein